MADSRTLTQLIAAVQTLGKYENSRDMTSAVITQFLNEAIAETYDILVEKWADYYLSSSTVAVVANTDTYALPATFYKLRKVEILLSGTRYAKLYPHDLDVAHRYTTVNGKAYRYRLQAGNIVFVPMPAASETVRLWFIPAFTRLVAGADTFDAINGYEDLVQQLAFKRCRDREELPHPEIDAEVARLTARVRTASDGRDATEAFSLDPGGPPRNLYYDDGEDWY